MTAASQQAPLPVRVDASVLENAHEGGPNYRLRLAVPEWPGSLPGQFVMLSPGVHSDTARYDPLLPRPMAVYRVREAEGGRALEILYKIHGRGTALLADARVGEAVRMVGPLGRSFPDPPAGHGAVLVGGGTGIASLYELAERLCAGGTDVQVLLGARGAVDLMGVDDFRALPCRVSVATEDGSEGQRGRVTVLLDAALAEDVTVYACGPTPMMRATAERAASAGRACHVSLENPMACGFGVCLGCAAPRTDGGFSLVCRDGPVFPAADIAWEKLA